VIGAPEMVLVLGQEFPPTPVEWMVFDRGREFPKHGGRSRVIFARDRRPVARGLGLEVSR
jgi:hypothetical protein